MSTERSQSMQAIIIEVYGLALQVLPCLCCFIACARVLFSTVSLNLHKRVHIYFLRQFLIVVRLHFCRRMYRSGLVRGFLSRGTLSIKSTSSVMPIFGSTRRDIVGTTSSLLENAVLKSVRHRYGFPLDGEKPTAPMVVQARPEHGDYQCTVAMSLAKKLKLKPRDVADCVLQDLHNDPDLVSLSMIDKMDVTGPGFINMRLSVPYIEGKLKGMQESGRMGVPVATAPQRVVVDFSSPNIAKEMHVVSLRPIYLLIFYSFIDHFK